MNHDDQIGENKKIGSCPFCGGSIWSHDKINVGIVGINIYRCLHCKEISGEEKIIPF